MADDSNNIGGSVSLDTTNFKAGVTDLNRQIRVIESGFRAASAGMDEWGKSEEGLRVKINSLNQVTDLQRQKIANLTQQYKLIAAAKGEDSKEAQNLQARINNETATLNKNQKELENTTKELKNQSSVVSKLGNDYKESFDKAKQSTGNLFEQVKNIGKTMTGIGVGIAAGLGVAAKGAADFEQSMANVYSVIAPDEVTKFSAELKNLAITMGAETKYSATEAAQGIEELIKAGVSVSDILNGGLNGALSLATAGEINLADAAEIASTALNAFKNDGLSVQQAADILAGAANASATSVSELKLGLSAVSTVASSVGWSFKDTTTALAEFAQNGLKGSDAGTSLKTMLMNLQPSTDASANAMKKLGIITADGSNKFVDAQGHFKNLSEVSNILQESMSGLTDAQRLTYMETIFGSDAIRAANILFKEGAKGADDMATSIGKISAKDVAAQKMNTLNGAIEQLSGSVETAKISIGNALIPILKGLSNMIQGVIDGFNNLSPSMQSTIAIIGVVTAVTTLVAGPLLILVGMLPLISAGFSMILGPVGLIIIGITAAATALGIFIATNEGFRNVVAGIWTSISSTVGGVVTAIVNFFTVTIPTAFNNFITFIAQLPGQIGSFFMQLPSIIGNLFMQALMAIVNWGANVVTWVATAIPNIITSIGTFFSQLPANIGYALGFVIGTLVKWAVDIGTWVVTNIPVIIGNIVNFFLELPGKIWDVLTNVISHIGEWGSNIIAWAAANLPTIIGNIITFFASLPGKLWDILVSAITHIGEWGKNIISWAAANLPGVISNIVSFFKSLPGNLVDIGIDLVKGLWNGITGMAKWVKDKIGEFAKGVVQGFKDALGIKSPSRIMREEVGKNITSGVAQGIVDGIPKVTDSVAQVAKGIIDNKGLITNAMQGLTDTSSDVEITNTSTIANVITPTDTEDPDKINEENGQNLNESLGKGLTDSTDKVTTPINGLVSTVNTTMTNMATSMNKTGQDVDTNLGVGVTNNSSAAINPVNNVIATVTNNVKTFTQSCIGHGEDTDTNLGIGVTNNSAAVTGAVNNVITTLGNSLNTFAVCAVQYGQGTDTSIASGITNTASAVTGAISNLLSNVTSILNTFVSSCTSIGTAIVTSIGEGIKSSQDNLTSIVHNLTQKVIEAFTGKDGFDIHSPSRKLFEIGANVIQGFINGMSSKDALAFFKNKIGGAISGVAGNVAGWLSTALALTGTSMSWLPGLEKLVQAESGGDPSAWNPIPVGKNKEHATGLLQTLPSTFASYAMKGLNNILNPIHNAVAAINYIKKTYGSVYNTPLFTSGGAYVGYERGTNNAAAGPAYINEKGWEYVDFSGGEVIKSHQDSIDMLNQAASAINLMNNALSGMKLATPSTVNTNTTTQNSSSNLNIDGDVSITLEMEGKATAQVVMPWLEILQGKNLRKKLKGVTG
ncbi:phage tail tape measure protein [Clostridium kluyveri]|uniref:Phage tail tape measure protein n=1 Tax=Clostridium kluyveri TaxID=1534 RepID=A0A1L5F989_CLOKL|nr:phage tail tape measure protein [Clostridium kluyveri]APM39390.1 phage tail tape measure protein [Clostridium kluyveri]